jgi:glycosyltransferase involved in cell wall biosynthesis
MKLIIINHTFQKPEFYKRWKSLAEKHEDLDVTLLAPADWNWGEEKTLTYGTVERRKGVVVDEDRFRIHLIDTVKTKSGDWTSKLLEKEIRKLNPDIVYFIGGYTAAAFIQILKLREREKMSMKVIAFSMRGHTLALQATNSYLSPLGLCKNIAKIIILKPRLDYFKKHCDAVFCHYPDALKAFRKEGYKGPVYMQTQVGVDPDVFYPNPVARKKIRDKYNIGDAFLFGSASRFHYSKGLSEIIQALPEEGNWKYLMMGWGRDDEVEKIKNEIVSRGLQDKIILTGFIDNWTDMAEHWNALDCAVHTPLTTPKWEETFSLALVQAMITGLPVIGSSSGSVPYQIGPDGIVIPEGNVEILRQTMLDMMSSLDKCKDVGNKMRWRALNCFSIYHLNDVFYDTIQDVQNGIYDEKKVDMSTYLMENYDETC